ncbi:cysteine--tRNA ligase [Candidatus Wolfebacteria bacterium CG_4_10_14_0_2_um_filter_39_18]|uniref:Cysteine--tRNA ligase n=1 Tax=Candidatus Wolfebacteria bacterium CG_4_10_14_0_2_um_filter_39_18 TaxID=1975061 RepID=A0A2M7TG47_9BACT|nr:MAG: cysteine--tRNA ligase [Candidatus Wolfebacteria bacterium CG_4_10_14_0_2_um_filter_39_18]
MIKLFNTLSGKKEMFKPFKGKTAQIYTCGPTVYNYAHLGNLRTYVFEDILRRALEINGYKIKQITNITDVEDKIIKKARQEKKEISQITRPYEKIFFEDLEKLNIEKAERYPRATEHIKEIINLISVLMKKGFAYQVEDKSVYFKISKFKNYGKLSRLKKRRAVGRIDSDEYKKDDVQDFVLWKSAKSNEPFWSSPWGAGRPGWHIECSAMSMKYLGKTLDIHAGGVDLIFPHHENEIAQSEAATGKKFSKFWIHGEHLLVDGEKMSKSLGNIFTLRDLKKKGVNFLAFRYLLLGTHYRKKLNFTWQSIIASQNSLNRLYRHVNDFAAQNPPTSKLRRASKKLADQYKKDFIATINDDLNTSKALSIVWEVIKEKNLPGREKRELLIGFDKVLGLGLKDIRPKKTAIIPRKIKDFVQKRELLRNNKQFIQADALRKQIEKLGYIVKDTSSGPLINRIKE